MTITIDLVRQKSPQTCNASQVRGFISEASRAQSIDVLLYIIRVCAENESLSQPCTEAMLSVKSLVEKLDSWNDLRRFYTYADIRPVVCRRAIELLQFCKVKCPTQASHVMGIAHVKDSAFRKDMLHSNDSLRKYFVLYLATIEKHRRRPELCREPPSEKSC